VCSYIPRNRFIGSNDDFGFRITKFYSVSYFKYNAATTK
jgi:hypothetical protein